MMLVFEEEFADGEHQDERGQTHGKGGDEAAPHTACGCIAHVGSAVDANGSRGHLTHCHNIGKLLGSEPSVTGHHLALYQGEHGISASKAKQANLEECPE